MSEDGPVSRNAEEFDGETWDYGIVGEAPATTLMRALANAERMARSDGGELRGFVVLAIWDIPPDADAEEPSDRNGADGLSTDWTPGLGWARRVGMLTQAQRAHE